MERQAVPGGWSWALIFMLVLFLHAVLLLWLTEPAGESQLKPPPPEPPPVMLLQLSPVSAQPSTAGQATAPTVVSAEAALSGEDALSGEEPAPVPEIAEAAEIAEPVEITADPPATDSAIAPLPQPPEEGTDKQEPVTDPSTTEEIATTAVQTVETTALKPSLLSQEKQAQEEQAQEEQAQRLAALQSTVQEPTAQAKGAMVSTGKRSLAARQATSTALSNWQALMLQKLDSAKRYPRMARYRRDEGIVQVHFSIDRAGVVLSTGIRQSSGHRLLDDEALALVQRAAPLPLPPAEVGGGVIELVVPVSFEMSDL